MSKDKSSRPLRRVGWGRIPLPWTKRRRMHTEQRGQELLREAIARRARDAAPTDSEPVAREVTHAESDPAVDTIIPLAETASPQRQREYELGQQQLNSLFLEGLLKRAAPPPGNRGPAPIEPAEWVRRAMALLHSSKISSTDVDLYVNELHSTAQYVFASGDDEEKASAAASLVQIVETLGREIPSPRGPAARLFEKSAQEAGAALAGLEPEHLGRFSAELRAYQWQIWRHYQDPDKF